MKIGSLDNKALGTPAVGNERKSGASGSAASTGKAEPSAKVELSSSASVSTDGDGDFDTAKVERVAQAIRDGKFQVNAEVIADKLISNAQELLGRGGNGGNGSN